MQPRPERFRITIGGVERQVTHRWNHFAAAWVMDVTDADGVPFLTGIPLVTGADLAGQFEYLALGGQLIVQTDHDPEAVPTFENLGSTGHLYLVTP